MTFAGRERFSFNEAHTRWRGGVREDDADLVCGDWRKEESGFTVCDGGFRLAGVQGNVAPATRGFVLQVKGFRNFEACAIGEETEFD